MERLNELFSVQLIAILFEAGHVVYLDLFAKAAASKAVSQS